MPYDVYHSGIWKLRNTKTGKVINVPSAKSREDAERVAHLREAYSHGFKRTKTTVRHHSRRGTSGVKKHSRRLT